MHIFDFPLAVLKDQGSRIWKGMRVGWLEWRLGLDGERS